jgi:hypothetical protein
VLVDARWPDMHFAAILDRSPWRTVATAGS